MPKFSFPDTHLRSHAPIRNVNELYDKQISSSQHAADWIAKTIGSWKFVGFQSVFFLVWVFLNVTAFIQHWDPYPFILMNLLLSTQAAYTAPMIMMSQNRQAAKGRIEAHNDYMINQKAEGEIRSVLELLEAQNKALIEIHQEIEKLREKTDH